MAYRGNYRDYMVSVFNDTMAKIDKSSTLRESVEHSIKGQEYIMPEAEVNYSPRFDSDARVTVTRRTSFDAARSHSGRVCVLNFASATTPGGGVTRGSSAQEECLCRCSTLYRCLASDDAEANFYRPNRDAHDSIHTDRAIFTPDVMVIKSDQYSDLYRDFRLDVITCAAPNLRENPSNQYNRGEGGQVSLGGKELHAVHVSRARRILSIAASHGEDAVILGAFGCGAFRNDPGIVASAYHEVLPEFMRCFKEIEFAIYCRDRETENYDAFSKVFG